MLERLKFKGRLGEKQLELKKLDLRISGLVSSLRSLLDPFCSVDELNARLIARQAIDLSEYHTMRNEVFEEILRLKKEIGHDCTL